MAIREDIVSKGHGPLKKPTHIVIHETANPGATAQNHRDYWSREDDYAVHAVCDWKEIIHTVPYNRLCWHVGNANDFTIGIEICHAESKANFTKAWKNAIEWTKAMMKEFGIPAKNVVSHDYCSKKWGGSDHTDPIGYFAEYGKTFDDFLKELGGSYGNDTKASPSKANDGKAAAGSDFAGGEYRVNVGTLNVRSKPSMSGSVVATYRRGETVTLDDWYTVADGYVWGRYTAYSGNVRYIAVGPHTGKAESNDYLVKK